MDCLMQDQIRRPIALLFFGRSNESTNQHSSCECCDRRHIIWHCDNCVHEDIADRWSLAKEKLLCYRCLGSSHCGSSCRRSRVCGLDGCSQVDHRLLHESNNRARDERPPTNITASTSSSLSEYQENRQSSAAISHAAVARWGGGNDNSQNLTATAMMTGELYGQYIALRTVHVILHHTNTHYLMMVQRKFWPRCGTWMNRWNTARYNECAEWTSRTFPDIIGHSWPLQLMHWH